MSNKWFRFWVIVLALECLLIGGVVGAREYQKYENQKIKEEKIRKIKQLRLQIKMRKQEAILYLEKQSPLFEMDCIVHTDCESVD